MLIAFWSTHHGQTATTTNLLSIALCAALKYKLKVLVGHAQPGITQMERALLSEDRLTGHASQTNENTGNALIRLARNKMLQSSTISNYTIPLLKESRLDVLNGYSLNLKQEDLQDVEVLKQILSTATDAYDIVFLDLHSGLEKDYTRALLEHADTVVVNLSQNKMVLDAFIEKKSSIKFKCEPILCIGRYQKSSRLTEKAIKKQMSTPCLVKVPQHTSLIDLMNEGNVLEFFGRHYYRERFEKKHPFFEDVAKSTHTLLKQLELVK
ncbi:MULTISPECIES: AAA family ATPase [unclassified Fusibacter]|uniref:MinD/ParA family ATP-binding protein n=1 Tax=unclassified Fusibacter TaxID=2624464 RepID=UPI0010136F79|nr:MULTISPECIES: AAA family ATPase [unclassified Fusibacter]MCK8060831.1 AAA family ATPase [Fusibacter sp. A2]NPE23127.1 AAA family ATPase [Fusibacter sp. A1]RXV59799.1 hypothetical protein DWB64_14945 [Fusibacter sp. A1]